MKQLIASFPILFENTEYKPGDKLPTHNAEFVKLWIENKSAVWKDTEESTEKPKRQGVKAKQVTAPAGRSGDAYPSAGPEQDLVGKPPSRKTRGAHPDPEKGRRKSSE